jgi:hypothetical protein
MMTGMAHHPDNKTAESITPARVTRAFGSYFGLRDGACRYNALSSFGRLTGIQLTDG